jgi:hypothetical protein
MQKMFELNFQEGISLRRNNEIEIFVRNCKTYGLDYLLEDEKNFLNPSIRHIVLNTNYLESVYRLQSKDSLLNNIFEKFKEIKFDRNYEVENKLDYNYKSVQNRNKLQNEILNDFADSGYADKISQYKETRSNNKNVISEYIQSSDSKEESTYENDLMTYYSKQMGDYLNQIQQKKLRKESFNLSMVQEKMRKEEKEIFIEAMSKGITEDEIKIYPGSVKGPEPEDDPAFYYYWQKHNQPKVLDELRKKVEKNGEDIDEDDSMANSSSTIFEDVKITSDRIVCNKATAVLNMGDGQTAYGDLDHYNEKEIFNTNYLEGSNKLM